MSRERQESGGDAEAFVGFFSALPEESEEDEESLFEDEPESDAPDSDLVPLPFCLP